MMMCTFAISQLFSLVWTVIHLVCESEITFHCESECLSHGKIPHAVLGGLIQKNKNSQVQMGDTGVRGALTHSRSAGRLMLI